MRKGKALLHREGILIRKENTLMQLDKAVMQRERCLLQMEITLMQKDKAQKQMVYHPTPKVIIRK